MLRKITLPELTGLLLAFAGSALAIPHAVNLEGRLTNVAGNPIQNPTQVEFRIFQGGSVGTADSGLLTYREVATVTPGPDGAYTHLLGAGSTIAGYQFTPDVFDTDEEVFLQLNIDNQAVLPRLRFASAPTAMLPQYPARFIGMFSGPCPSGWTRFTDLDDVFPKGGPAYGTRGGSATHDHGGSTGGPNQMIISDAGSNFASPVSNHTHSIASDSNIPPYVTVVFCQKS
jgi:hypothetical protein